MKNRAYLLNTLLAAVVGVALLAIVLLRTFLPQVIIPRVSIPNLALLSLVALVLDHYLAKDADRCYICIPVFAAVTFGLLPWIAGYIPAAGIWKLALSGAAVFTAAAWLIPIAAGSLINHPRRKQTP